MKLFSISTDSSVMIIVEFVDERGELVLIVTCWGSEAIGVIFTSLDLQSAFLSCKNAWWCLFFRCAAKFVVLPLILYIFPHRLHETFYLFFFFLKKFHTALDMMWGDTWVSHVNNTDGRLKLKLTDWVVNLKTKLQNTKSSRLKIKNTWNIICKKEGSIQKVFLSRIF